MKHSVFVIALLCVFECAFGAATLPLHPYDGSHEGLGFAYLQGDAHALAQKYLYNGSLLKPEDESVSFEPSQEQVADMFAMLTEETLSLEQQKLLITYAQGAAGDNAGVVYQHVLLSLSCAYSLANQSNTSTEGCSSEDLNPEVDDQPAIDDEHAVALLEKNPLLQAVKDNDFQAVDAALKKEHAFVAPILVDLVKEQADTIDLRIVNHLSFYAKGSQVKKALLSAIPSWRRELVG